MQKFTIFTIIFSVIVVSITTELVVQDYLEKLYPDPSTLQANIISNDDTDTFINDQRNLEDEKEPEPKEEENNSAPIDQESEDRIKELLDNLEKETEEPEPLSASSIRINTLLPALPINSVEYSDAAYPGKLFHLIETTDIETDQVAYGIFRVGDNAIGSAYEFKFATELEGESAFQLILRRASNFQDITVNQTDQFGEESFYINNVVKVAEVFLVFRRDNYVYAFAYKKDLHDAFKEFFDILV